jgi:hypothetical protein
VRVAARVLPTPWRICTAPRTGAASPPGS